MSAPETIDPREFAWYGRRLVSQPADKIGVAEAAQRNSLASAAQWLAGTLAVQAAAVIRDALPQGHRLTFDCGGPVYDQDVTVVQVHAADGAEILVWDESLDPAVLQQVEQVLDQVEQLLAEAGALGLVFPPAKEGSWSGLRRQLLLADPLAGTEFEPNRKGWCGSR